jgi:hypothetical protein
MLLCCELSFAWYGDIGGTKRAPIGHMDPYRPIENYYGEK